VTFRLAYCAIDGSPKSESVGVLLPLATLAILFEARVRMIAFAAQMNADH